MLFRSRQRAEELAAAAGSNARVASLEDVASGSVRGDVLINTTSVGMSPGIDDSPLPAAALSSFTLAFDAIYNPPMTRLLKVRTHSPIGQHQPQ